MPGHCLQEWRIGLPQEGGGSSHHHHMTWTAGTGHADPHHLPATTYTAL